MSDRSTAVRPWPAIVAESTGPLRTAASSPRRPRHRATVPLPPLLPDEPGPSRQDFVGRTVPLRAQRTGMDSDRTQGVLADHAAH
ncbi:hypothetical protein [Streptomyces sp. NPDC059491]|uniref:hypothetical protein n=1 Tax=Streptomyces sp. NPDC059491 TaxID=3346850 RepID=UPI0036BF374C